MSVKKISLFFICFGLVASLFAAGAFSGYKYPSVFGLAQKEELNREKTALGDLVDDGTIDFSIFWQVWDLAQTEHYARPADASRLIYGAINGVLQFGLKDQYSSFTSPEVSANYNETLGAEYGGVGLELDMNGRVLMVVSSLPGGSALEQGLMPGDMITAIDGTTTEGMTVLEASSMLRGPLSSTVEVDIRRVESDGTLTETTLDLERRTLNTQTLSWDELDPTVFYIKIRNFSADTQTQWKNTVDHISKNNPTKIILDLRSNPGGNTNAVRDVVSDFVEEGLVYALDYGQDEKKEVIVTGQGKLYDVPLFVLTNTGTASAAEMVAGALQDHERAKLIGVTSFGKGVIQDQFEIPVPNQIEPGILSLVTAKWYTPNGTWVSENPLEPDVIVQTTHEQYINGEDPVLERALSEVVITEAVEF